MHSVSPVFGEQEVQFERIISLDRLEYDPLILVPISSPDADGTLKPRAICVRFRLSPTEREAITNGADLIVTTELTFGNLFTPLNFQFCQPDQKPAYRVPIRLVDDANFSTQLNFFERIFHSIQEFIQFRKERG